MFDVIIFNLVAKVTNQSIANVSLHHTCFSFKSYYS